MFRADRRYGWRPLCAACALLLLLLSCSPCFFYRARPASSVVLACAPFAQCYIRVLDGNAHIVYSMAMRISCRGDVVSAPLAIHYLSCLLICRSCATHQPITPRCLHRACCLRTIHAYTAGEGVSASGITNHLCIHSRITLLHPQTCPPRIRLHSTNKCTRLSVSYLSVFNLHAVCWHHPRDHTCVRAIRHAVSSAHPPTCIRPTRYASLASVSFLLEN